MSQRQISPPSSPSHSRIPTVPLRPPSSPLRPTSPTPPPASTAYRSSKLSRQDSLEPPTPTPKTRARDLLRKHYGLGVGPPPPLPGKLADPMDLDSTAFDAKAYYKQLITTSSLPALLKRENELLSEIRQLDSERQSLVYNHHHELIAASDTIAAMKTRAENLDSNMDLLKDAFSEISRLSAVVAIETSSHLDPAGSRSNSLT